MRLTLDELKAGIRVCSGCQQKMTKQKYSKHRSHCNQYARTITRLHKSINEKPRTNEG